MKIRYLLCAILFLGLNINDIYADDNTPIGPVGKDEFIFVGVTGGYNAVMHSANLKTFAKDVICPTFEDGNASGFHGGIFYEQMLGELGTAHSIIARLLYNTYPTDFSQLGDKLLSRVTDPTKQPTDPEYEKDIMTTLAHTNSVKYNAVSLDLMYKFKFLSIPGFGGLVASVGPTMDYIITKTRSQKVSLTDPANVQFKQQELTPGQSYSADRRTIIAFDGDIEEAKSMRFGIKTGMQIEIKIPGIPFDILPGAFYNFGLTDVNNQDWKVNAIQVGVDFRFAIKF